MFVVYALIFGFGMAVTILIVLALTLADPASVAIARHINLLTSWSFILIGVTFVLSAVPRANGATIPPLIIMTLALGLSVAFLLTGALGPDALWYSFPIGSAIAVSLAWAYYVWGGWRTLRPLAAEEQEERSSFLKKRSKRLLFQR